MKNTTKYQQAAIHAAAMSLIVCGAIASTDVEAAVVFNNSLAAGISQFDSTIATAGGTVQTQQIIGNQTIYSGFTVTRPAGGTPITYGAYSNGGVSLTGNAYEISPASSSSDGLFPAGYNSGIRITFAAPVNAVGFEIGDWATCCTTGTRSAATQSAYGVPATGSGLWIGFDGGALSLTANAITAANNPGVAATGSYTNFIGAVDTSNTFSSVTFFGDGFGEFLVAGGTIRYSTLAVGTVVPPPAVVPVPAALPLLLSGLGALGFIARRKRL